MKTLSKYLVLAMLLSPIAQLPLKAEETPVSTTIRSNHLEKDANEKATMARLKAIRELAKTNLSKAEKKALREEVKAIRDQQGPVIFISTGAVILIVILLIILL